MQNFWIGGSKQALRRASRRLSGRVFQRSSKSIITSLALVVSALAAGRHYLPSVPQPVSRSEPRRQLLVTLAFLGVLCAYLILIGLSLTDLGLSSRFGDVLLLGGPFILSLFFIRAIALRKNVPAKTNRVGRRSRGQLSWRHWFMGFAVTSALATFSAIALANGELGTLISLLIVGLLAGAIWRARREL